MGLPLLLLTGRTGEVRANADTALGLSGKLRRSGAVLQAIERPEALRTGSRHPPRSRTGWSCSSGAGPEG